MYLRIALSIIRYIPSGIAVLLGKLLTFIVSPILALPFFVRHEVETKVTGKPGKLDTHEFLQPWLMWFQTHDAPLDEWWTAGYGEDSWIKRKYTQEDYDSKGWLRYLCRIMWLWRNPAYGLAHALGYDQHGMVDVYKRDEGELWDSGYPNFSVWLVKNIRNQYGFMVEWQFYYYKQRCIELYVGWKLHRDDPDRKCMIAVRFSPFRKYERKDK